MREGWLLLLLRRGRAFLAGREGSKECRTVQVLSLMQMLLWECS
jgi:hypothetical protein